MDRKHLLIHHRKVYYDRGIPKHLRHLMGGRTRYRINLNTSDLAEAVKMRAKCDALFVLTIDKAQRTLDGTLGKAEAVERMALELKARDVGIDLNTGEEVDGLLDREEIERVHDQIEGPLREVFRDTFNGRPVRRIDTFVAPWVASMGHLGGNTVLERKSVAKKLLKWGEQNGVFDATKVTRDHAKAFIKTITGAPATIGKAIQACTSLWKFMAEEGIEVNPDIWKGLAPKKGRRVNVEELERAFSDEEVKTLLNGDPSPADGSRGLPSPRLRDSMVLALLTGARLAELGALKVQHLDFDKGTVFIPGSKTDTAPRTIPMHRDLVTLLRARTEGKAKGDFIIHELGDGKDLKNGRKRSAALAQEFTRYRRSVGVDDRIEGKRRALVNFHSFRRTVATKLKEAGVATEVRDALQGWAGDGAMRDRYAVSADMMGRMREALEYLKLPG